MTKRKTFVIQFISIYLLLAISITYVVGLELSSCDLQSLGMTINN